MIARSAPPFTFRNILDRVGLASMQLAFYREGGSRLNLWQRTFAALGDWSSVSAVSWRSILRALSAPPPDSNGVGDRSQARMCGELAIPRERVGASIFVSRAECRQRVGLTRSTHDRRRLLTARLAHCPASSRRSLD